MSCRVGEATVFNLLTASLLVNGEPLGSKGLNDIVTGPRNNPFAGISVAVNLNDEAEMEFDPMKVSTDDSGSYAEDIDIQH